MNLFSYPFIFFLEYFVLFFLNPPDFIIAFIYSSCLIYSYTEEMLSSFFNNSHLHSNVSSTSFFNFFYTYCLMSRPSSFIYSSLNIFRIVLIFPPCIFILNHGLQQRKKHPSPSSWTMSHSDHFTYHVVIMELIDLLGHTLSLTGIYNSDATIIFFGVICMFFAWYGQISFHTLTCVERYMAVVHPITYVGLKNERGTRIRNSFIGFVWLLSFLGMGLVLVQNLFFPACMLLLCLMTVSFCSMSVLCVLIRPGPGEKGENKETVVPSRQRAFYTILAILAVLLLRITWGVIYFVLYLRKGTHDCIIIVSSGWFTIPSSLVLPLLFLHRVGKLVCCNM